MLKSLGGVWKSHLVGNHSGCFHSNQFQNLMQTLTSCIHSAFVCSSVCLVFHGLWMSSDRFSVHELHGVRSRCFGSENVFVGDQREVRFSLVIWTVCDAAVITVQTHSSSNAPQEQHIHLCEPVLSLRTCGGTVSPPVTPVCQTGTQSTRSVSHPSRVDSIIG